MLTIRKTIQFHGESRINDTPVKFYNATITEDNPDGLMINSNVANNDLYRANRESVAADQTAFEDAVYAFRDQLIAEKAAQA